MAEVEDVFGRLRRYPDVEAHNLYAVDAADRLILDVAGEALAGTENGRLAVLGDSYGALTIGAISQYELSAVRVYQDLLTGERALANNARVAGLADRYTVHPLDERLLAGAEVVLLRLPRALTALAEIADAIARYAAPTVRVFAGGRDKHLTKTMNDVLAQYFSEVRASRGRQKSRTLLVSDPKPVGEPPFPVHERLDDLDIETTDGGRLTELDVVAHGSAFSGARIDIGTRFLLEHLRWMKLDAGDAIDLGCGTGILATALAKTRTDIKVVGTDQSRSAVASAVATAAANDVADRVMVIRDDAMSATADNSADLVLCNPPFHVGAAVHTGAAIKMFAETGRVLRPGGELWTVYNSHLNYRHVMQRLVGDTEVVGRNRKFTVTRSVRGPHETRQR